MPQAQNIVFRIPSWKKKPNHSFVLLFISLFQQLLPQMPWQIPHLHIQVNSRSTASDWSQCASSSFF